MEIQFNEEKTVVVRPAETKKLTKLTIDRVTDVPSEKKVYARVKEIVNIITLWSDDEYDNIGQWTDVDVVNRIHQMFS